MIFGKKIFFRFLWEKITIFNFFQKSWIFFSNFFSILGKKNWKFREKIENRDFLSQKSKKIFFSKNHFFRFPRWFFSPEDFFLVLPQPSEKSKIHVYFYPILLVPKLLGPHIVVLRDFLTSIWGILCSNHLLEPGKHQKSMVQNFGFFSIFSSFAILGPILCIFLEFS